MLKKFILRVLILLGCQFYFSPAVHAFDSEAYEYMTAEIKSLGLVKDAFDAISTAPTADNFSRQTADVKKSIDQLKSATNELAKYKGHSNEYVAQSVNAFQRIYATAVALNEEKLALLEKLSAMSPEEIRLNKDTLASYETTLAAKSELFWKSLSQAANLSTFALIDFTRKKDDKTPYFSVKKDEQNNLLKQLEDTFGEEIKKDPKLLEHRFAGIPAAIRTFLNSSDLKPSDTY